ncbi:hypothetical protein ACW0JT_20675 [Arthrobacter sp. SA17]
MAAAAAAVTAGVLVTTNLGALTALPEPAGTASAQTSNEATPVQTSTATASSIPTPMAVPVWTRFTDASGQATFEHPVGWRVQETSPTGGFEYGNWSSSIVVLNEAGKVMGKMLPAPHTAGGGECAPVPYSTLDAVPVDIPQKPTPGQYVGATQFKFRIIEGAAVYGAMTIDSSSIPATGSACQLSSSIQTPKDVPALTFGSGIFLSASGTDASMTFASVAEAGAYMQTQEYKDIKRMLISLELRSVSKPATWKNYTSQNGLGSFDYPDHWIVASREDGRYSDVVNEQGRTLLTLGFGQTRNIPNVPGNCPPFTVLDSTPMSFPSDRQGQRAIQPQFIFRVRDVSRLTEPGTSAPFTANLGIADESWGVDGTTCDPQNVVSGLPSGEYFFAQNYYTGDSSDLKFSSMEEARAYMETEEFKTLKRIVTSLKIDG